MLRAAPTTKRGGLNIVGPFEGTSVEADVARRLAAALRAGGVPISTTSYHRDDRDLGSAWSHRGPSDFPFDVNLLVVHPDHMTDFVLDSGPGLFHDRYTIGLWVWDLQVPSSSMADAARMVHEVWTPTSRGHGSASSVFGGPVHGVPIPVGGEPTAAGPRCTRPAGRPRLRMQRRLRQRVRPSEPAGCRAGVHRSLLAEGWPSPRHRRQPRRPVPAGARSARRPGRRASRCGDTSRLVRR